VHSPASLGKPMKESIILTTSTIKADTNWLKSGSTSFHPVILLIHITPSCGTAPHSKPSTVKPIYQSAPPSNFTFILMVETVTETLEQPAYTKWLNPKRKSYTLCAECY
jgi:hypothetical protein